LGFYFNYEYFCNYNWVKTYIMKRNEVSKKYPEIYKFLHEIVQTEDANDFIKSIWNQIKTNKDISIKQINGVRNTMLYFEKKQKTEELKEKHSEDKPRGLFIGKLRKRYDMTLKYISCRPTSRGYYIQQFIDKDNNYLMCFSNQKDIECYDKKYFTPADKKPKKSPSPKVLGMGDVFTCRATVVRHNVNDYEPSNKFKQTIINRVKYMKYLGNKNKNV